ncbi:hypothetical protein GHT09_013107 [Marmota monax]|uniref:Uncharacterized protein n=1 Tax=Marmota monax TaxID=9995 RepID=A0A834QG58_MARMO|nr:hypothetical protein GHT09_013107 [Marmota monax]
MDVRVMEKKPLLGCVVSGPGSKTKAYDSKERLEYLKSQLLMEDHLGTKDSMWSPRSVDSYHREGAKPKARKPRQQSSTWSGKPRPRGPVAFGLDSKPEGDWASQKEEGVRLRDVSEAAYKGKVDMPSPKLGLSLKEDQRGSAEIRGDEAKKRDPSRPKKTRAFECMYWIPDCDSDTLSEYLENREEIVVVEVSSSESACSAPGPQAGSPRVKSQQCDWSAPEDASVEDSSATAGSLRRKKTSGEEERRKFRRDGEVVLEADFGEASDHLTSSPKLRKGAQSREKEATALSPNRRMICVLKGDPDYDIALEDLDNSQDEWIYEVEGLFQEVHAEDRLIYMKGRIFKEIGTAEPWRSEVPHPPLLLLSGGAKTGELKPPKLPRLKTEEGCETLDVGCQKAPSEGSPPGGITVPEGLSLPHLGRGVSGPVGGANVILTLTSVPVGARRPWPTLQRAGRAKGFP